MVSWKRIQKMIQKRKRYEEDPEECDDEEEEMEVDDEEDPERGSRKGDMRKEEMEVDMKRIIFRRLVPDEPPPPLFQFDQNFHVGESSSTRTLLDNNSQSLLLFKGLVGKVLRYLVIEHITLREDTQSLSVDIAKITRKRLKPGKHEHGNGRAHKEPGECYQKSTMVNSSQPSVKHGQH
ncbi:hypothetical protein Tco_0595956 [Tanacetum coccineum]